MKYLFLVAILCLSCSPEFFCNRCKSFARPDTVFATKTITTAGRGADTLFIAQPGDTVYVNRDKIHVKYVLLPGDSVYIGCNCEPDTIKIDVPVLVTNEIKTGIAAARAYWLVASAAILALVVGIVAGRVLRKV